MFLCIYYSHNFVLLIEFCSYAKLFVLIVYKYIFDVSGDTEVSLAELIQHLKKLYCDSISLEASYVENQSEKEWLHHHFSEFVDKAFVTDDKLNICNILIKSQVVHNF